MAYCNCYVICFVGTLLFKTPLINILTKKLKIKIYIITNYISEKDAKSQNELGY